MAGSGEIEANIAAIDTALCNHSSALAAFRRLPPSHQRKYALWIDGARKAGTRQRRILGMIDMLNEAS